MHLRLTQEHTDRTLLVKARYLGVHLPSNTTTKERFTMKACHSMDRMEMEAMGADSQSSATCPLGGILELRIRQSSLSKETQGLHKISDRRATVIKVAFWFIPQVLRQIWAYRYLSSRHICNHYSVCLHIVSIDPVHLGRINRAPNTDSSIPSRHGAAELYVHVAKVLLLLRFCFEQSRLYSAGAQGLSWALEGPC